MKLCMEITIPTNLGEIKIGAEDMTCDDFKFMLVLLKTLRKEPQPSG